MGSVIVSWKGTCRERVRQEALAEQIEPLATLSHSYFRDHPAIVRYDGPLEGRVLVSHNVLSDSPLTMSPPADLPDDLPGGIELRVAGSADPPKLRLSIASEASDVAVFGTVFRLYDGRSLYPGEDEVSLVWASSPGHPELDGRLVAVHDRTDCAASDNVVLKGADWYLTPPSIHLRYYCEQWMDLLLGTIKYFFVPDLDFWRYEHNPQYEQLAEVLVGEDAPDLVDRAFATLADNFRDNVERWRETAASVDEFWQAARTARERRTG